MVLRAVTYVILNIIIQHSASIHIFHENTNIMFKSDNSNHGHFGYSTLLTDNWLLVGAPKAANTGEVYLCSLRNLNVRQTICRPMTKVRNTWVSSKTLPRQKDSWFGVSIATLSNNKLLVTAPRYSPGPKDDGYLHGACYSLSRKRSSFWNPLSEITDAHNQTFRLDGKRPTYGKTSSYIYYYAFGQTGFAMAVTKMNTVILGAPGLMQLTGGIISYSFYPNDVTKAEKLEPIANTYYTMDLESDDYFGYSVQSGIFEKNGSVLYIGGAPRSHMGRGKVLIIEPPTATEKAMNIKYKLVGQQTGSYFGASLCCTDINNDGLDDLLVGAPTFVKKDGALPYDQGAVFIYLAKESTSGFVLQESGYVAGSGVDQAKFGTTIVDLGDINSDDYRDIAVGAPFENDGVGAVYIYLGNAKGLRDQYAQRIQPADTKGFGWSISKGFDVDRNKCNDVAIGAFNSGASYLFRCIPTMLVHASIRVSRILSLPRNITTFTTLFCVSTPPMKLWPDVKLNLTARIEVDPIARRANLVGDNEYNITVTPANEVCTEKTINVNLTANLMNRIPLKLKLEAHELMAEYSTTFLTEATRLSEDSTMEASQSVKVLIDCGDDLICSPWFNVTLEALDNPYVPGTNDKLGVKLTIANEAEPAYGVSVNIYLPTHPKRIPRECYLKELVITCDLPQPFFGNDVIVWEVEIEDNFNETAQFNATVTAEMLSMFYPNITQDYVHNVTIAVKPEFNFSISGQAMPNTSIIFRDTLEAGGNISFKHFYTISNAGPSDCHALIVNLVIPYKTFVSDYMQGCRENEDSLYVCSWPLPANTSIAVAIPLQMDLRAERDFLESMMNYTVASSVSLILNQSDAETTTDYQVSTILILEKASIPIWYILIPCIFVGLLLLSIITWILYKRNFFVRKNYEQLKKEEINKETHDLSQLPEDPASLLDEKHEMDEL